MWHHNQKTGFVSSGKQLHHSKPPFLHLQNEHKTRLPHRIKQVPICTQDTVQMWLFSSPPIQSQAQILPLYRDLPLLPHLGQNPLFYEDTVGNRKVSSSASRLRAVRRSLKSLHETEFGCDSFIYFWLSPLPSPNLSQHLSWWKPSALPSLHGKGQCLCTVWWNHTTLTVLFCTACPALNSQWRIIH